MYGITDITVITILTVSDDILLSFNILNDNFHTAGGQLYSPIAL